MGTEFLFVAVIVLACFAILDLMVGVSNDAANFLNASLGSRVAPRAVIILIASLGIIAGVTFSSGMMEVARKGIFHPAFFTMPELITIFLAVMITDLILLDLFNTYGLPTSTTVSIVFELLGAAVAVSLLKIAQASDGILALGDYINTSKAMIIIFGILLSIVVSFIFGATAQFLTRLLFTFDYASRFKRYGALWGGLAMASITYFILVKGAKGASFITAENAAWIKSHWYVLVGIIFVISVILLKILQILKFNILKPIVLAGTFALAMAFAANDLVNFIGVPLAGFHSYMAAKTADGSLDVTMTMGALAKKVPSSTLLLLLAGLIMVLTLWFSKKARTVSNTEIGLAQQEEGLERFESSAISRGIVRLVMNLFATIKHVTPAPLRAVVGRRMDPSAYQATLDSQNRPSFDLLRASVNLMVASVVVSYATANKLPLSTTYVTFMVAMGTSFADHAWGRESAVYRVTGVLTVIGGWFVTALTAFTIAGIFAAFIFIAGAYGVGALLVLAALSIWRNHHTHKARVQASLDTKVFNLETVDDAPTAITTTFGHMSILLKEIRISLDATLEALFAQNEYGLWQEKKKSKRIQTWVNIIIANVFKAMRQLQKSDEQHYHKFAQTIRRLQKLADGHHDIVLRAHTHVSNHHKGLLEVQVNELRQVKELLNNILLEVESTFAKTQAASSKSLIAKDEVLRQLAEKLNGHQIERICSDESKTRLSILFYAIVGNAMMLSKQNIKLIELFEESFGQVSEDPRFDLD